MKKLLISVIIFACIGLHRVQAQDVDINIVTQENGVNDGVWAVGSVAGTTTILVTICNNDGGVRAVPPNKLRPLISVPGAICQIDLAQPNLPVGWSIVSNNGSSIRLCNGTDTWAPGVCREFAINVTPTAQGGPLTITATMGWANGVSCAASGPQTTGNDPSNDNSVTAVIVTPNVSLPINLMSFTGAVSLCQTTLNWKVSAESNSELFEIEQSNDGHHFSKAGELQAISGRQDYQFRSAHPGGQIYYRLKMKDLDGKVTYSPVIKVTSACGGQDSFRVYPNPVKLSTSFRIEFGRSGKYDVQLINAVGVVLDRRQVNAVAGQVVEENCSRYAAGSYFLKIINTSTGEEGRHKLVIQ